MAVILALTLLASPEPTLFTGACPKWDVAASQSERRAAASEAVETADALFRDGQPEAALAQIDLAECHFEDRDYDFMRGTIHQAGGDCGQAVAAFEDFLAQDPPAVDARAAESRIRACQPPEPEVVLKTPPPPLPEPPPPQMNAKHWSRDVGGGVLLGIGVAGLAAGTGLLIASTRVEIPTGGGFEAYEEFAAAAERSQRLRGAGIGTMVVGSTLVVGAIIRYAVVARRANRNQTLSRR